VWQVEKPQQFLTDEVSAGILRGPEALSKRTASFFILRIFGKFFFVAPLCSDLPFDRAFAFARAFAFDRAFDH
jgi:hypothetical protein